MIGDKKSIQGALCRVIIPAWNCGACEGCALFVLTWKEIRYAEIAETDVLCAGVLR